MHLLYVVLGRVENANECTHVCTRVPIYASCPLSFGWNGQGKLGKVQTFRVAVSSRGQGGMSSRCERRVGGRPEPVLDRFVMTWNFHTAHPKQPVNGDP